jgi:hypothetical protein
VTGLSDAMQGVECNRIEDEEPRVGRRTVYRASGAETKDAHISTGRRERRPAPNRRSRQRSNVADELSGDARNTVDLRDPSALVMQCISVCRCRYGCAAAPRATVSMFPVGIRIADSSTGDRKL